VEEEEDKKGEEKKKKRKRRKRKSQKKRKKWKSRRIGPKKRIRRIQDHNKTRYIYYMMDTLLCLIYLHANTFTPIYTCLKIQFKKHVTPDPVPFFHPDPFFHPSPAASEYRAFPGNRVGTRLYPS